jgi:hypothetical protein
MRCLRLFLVVALCWCGHSLTPAPANGADAPFEALRIRREAAFVVSQPMDKTFPLFTPKGEELWSDQWRPTYIFPKSGETQESMIFVTGPANAERVIWRMEIYDPAHGHVRYSRISPSNRYGVVEVECSTGGAGTKVKVTYEFTALSEAGNKFIREFTEENYRAMIGEWKAAIGKYFSRTNVPVRQNR